jgi:hypothetical protein
MRNNIHNTYLSRCVGAGCLVMFYPKFHCELNWIEYYCRACKHYVHGWYHPPVCANTAHILYPVFNLPCGIIHAQPQLMTSSSVRSSRGDYRRSGLRNSPRFPSTSLSSVASLATSISTVTDIQILETDSADNEDARRISMISSID